MSELYERMLAEFAGNPRVLVLTNGDLWDNVTDEAVSLDGARRLPVDGVPRVSEATKHRSGATHHTPTVTPSESRSFPQNSKPKTASAPPGLGVSQKGRGTARFSVANGLVFSDVIVAFKRALDLGFAGGAWWRLIQLHDGRYLIQRRRDRKEAPWVTRGVARSPEKLADVIDLLERDRVSLYPFPADWDHQAVTDFCYDEHGRARKRFRAPKKAEVAERAEEGSAPAVPDTRGQPYRTAADYILRRRPPAAQPGAS